MNFQKNASILTIKMFIYVGSFIVGVQKKEKGFQDFYGAIITLQITFI
jgi:hypothetical protein